MADFIQSAFSALRLAIFIGMSGAIFALGCAVVCRWLKWAPINITINNHSAPPREDAGA